MLAPVELQVKNCLAQVSRVEPETPGHVEVLLALAARSTKRVRKFGRLLGSKRKIATLTVRAEPRLKAFPAGRANGSATRLLEFLAAEQTISREHYGTHGAEQFREEGGD
jgi:hypothetical protein